jgi:hypothetical protein
MRTISIIAAAAALLAPVPVLAQWSGVRDAQLKKAAELMADRGYSPVGTFQESSLDDGDSETITVTLHGGIDTYLVGICDSDCEDLDLTLYDPRGNELVSDVLKDDVPMLELTPSGTGIYRLKITMADCNTDPCYFGVQVYE